MGKRKERTPLQKKIMAAVCELSSCGVLPSADGAVHLLQGSIEARDYASLLTYSCLCSLSGRRGKAAIRKLIDEGVLFSSFFPKGEDFFLSLDGGHLEEAQRYLEWVSKQRKTLKARKIEFLER